MVGGSIFREVVRYHLLPCGAHELYLRRSEVENEFDICRVSVLDI